MLSTSGIVISRMGGGEGGDDEKEEEEDEEEDGEDAVGAVEVDEEPVVEEVEDGGGGDEHASEARSGSLQLSPPSPWPPDEAFDARVAGEAPTLVGARRTPPASSTVPSHQRTSFEWIYGDTAAIRNAWARIATPPRGSGLPRSPPPPAPSTPPAPSGLLSGSSCGGPSCWPGRRIRSTISPARIISSMRRSTAAAWPRSLAKEIVECGAPAGLASNWTERGAPSFVSIVGTRGVLCSSKGFSIFHRYRKKGNEE